MQPSLRVHQGRQRVDVRGLELRDLPVLEDERHRLVPLLQLLEDRCVRRTPGAGPLRGGQRELVEQDRLELLRRADVERVADELEDPRLQPGELRPELVAHGGERTEVDEHAGELHARQHRDERHLDLVEQVAE